MRYDLVSKYDIRIPRYTSYPTSPHFINGTNSQLLSDKLSQISNEPVSLYLHIPFCREICLFCACHTQISRKSSTVSAYVLDLISEINQTCSQIKDKANVGHIHFGGGSPTILSPKDIELIFNCLHNNFNILPNATIATEIDARTCTDDYIKTMASYGINRASLGIQDFTPKVQQAINRHQSFEITKQTVDGLRENGITDINFDLVYGLPHQGEDELLYTVEKSAELNPNRYAIFGYAHVPWMKKHQQAIDEASLPNAQLRWRENELVNRIISGKGYKPIGIDHYAKEDDVLYKALKDHKINRNFQGYTTDNYKNLIGFGVSSISYIEGAYFANEIDLRSYHDLTKSNQPTHKRYFNLSPDDLIRKDIISELMCYLQVDLTKYHQEFDLELSALKELENDGIIQLNNATISIKPKMHGLTRAVCATFDTYLTHGEVKHSRAV